MTSTNDALLREIAAIAGEHISDALSKGFNVDTMIMADAILSALPASGWRDERKSTGAKDDEGREIFEGDWVEFNVSFFDGNFRDEPISGKVVYVPELMSFQLVNVQSDYWREYTGGDDSTYQPFSELTYCESDFRIIDPPLPDAPTPNSEVE